MADYTSKAQVVISVNGKQAQKILKDLEKQAEILHKKMDEAAKIGDKESLKRIQRELKNVERQMNQITGAAQSVEQVLARMDKATPKELKKALTQLQKELNGIERGSAAWDAQMKKIQAVKAELNRVNEQMRETQSMAERVNEAFNKWQMAIMGAVAAITGVIMASRKAVNAFAEMDEEMANTRKFTGMTADEVAKLNDEFRDMDTRTARAELNQLAQEAGRLGKTTQEDVMGYVKAADIINVALSDLGEGATQKIAKLSNIFKIEDQYGTYDSMVKIGSVVNVLSQNCTASKPYLVEFANRLAGVGNMAKVSLQNIIGMGAVLDANAQKVEASATAIGQVLTRMYREPAKYAKVAGLEVQGFTDLLKKDANEAFLQFLNALKNAGGMDVLAPMFKDMGENGARAITALATMAQHIDEVRSQQLEANKAFDEGKSVLHEYEIFNNTAQSSIDKAKKSVQELAIQLGEKLYPAMKYVHSSTSILMKVINSTVDFLIKFHAEIAVAAAAVLSYTVAMNLATIRTKANAAAIVLHNTASTAMSKVLPVLRLMFAALQNAVAYFTNGLRVSYEMQNRWSNAMGAMTKANWIGLILTAATAVTLLAKRFADARKAAEEARRQNEEYRKSLVDISGQSAKYAAQELKSLSDLYDAAKDNTKSQKDRFDAAKKLNELYPNYFKALDDEKTKILVTKEAYDKLTKSIIAAAEAKGAQEKIEDLARRNVEDQMWLSQNEADIKAAEAKRSAAKKKADNAKKESPAASAYSMPSPTSYGSYATPAETNRIRAEKNYQNVVEQTSEILDEKAKRERQIAESNKAIDFLNRKYGGSPYARNGNGSAGDEEGGASSSGGASTSGVSSPRGERFKTESDWREKEEALNRIAYAKGEKDFVDYTKRMNEIAVAFYDMQLQHADLSELERTKITADYEEARKKEAGYVASLSAEEEKQRHREAVAELNQFYADGKISHQTYVESLEESELTHKYLMTRITQEGSEERIKAEEEYNDLRISMMQKRQKEYEDLEKKFEKTRGQYFTLSEEERHQKYLEEVAVMEEVYRKEKDANAENKKELLRLEEEYQKAILEIKRKYNLIAEEEIKSSYRDIMGSVSEWLESEMGSAVSKGLSQVSSSMSAIMTQMNSLMSAELDIQTAKVEKRYDRELQLAEGNSYRIKAIEEQKEQELAKLKSDANKKMFAMQVIQAVAQTATNALNAYGSAAAIPVVGHIIAPIAAASAIAAGAIQVAAIKKQQQASEAQGYAEGGFTKKGAKLEPAGIVHAGEWVASQKLVNNPKIRPLLETLDEAQRSNSVGSLRMEDVSLSVTAPAVMAAVSQRGYSSGGFVAKESDKTEVIVQENKELKDVLRRLSKRLEEPLVAATTVTGDKGISRNLERYNRLMKNKG